MSKTLNETKKQTKEYFVLKNVNYKNGLKAGMYFDAVPAHVEHLVKLEKIIPADKMEKTNLSNTNNPAAFNNVISNSNAAIPDANKLN